MKIEKIQLAKRFYRDVTFFGFSLTNKYFEFMIPLTNTVYVIWFRKHDESERR